MQSAAFINTWPDTQNDLNDLICNIMRSQDKHVPSVTEFKNHGDAMHTGWGIFNTGTVVFNGISGEGVDPFYPEVFGKCSNKQ